MERGTAATRLCRVTLAGAVSVVLAVGCAQPRVAEVYPQVAEFEGREISEVTFENTAPFSADSLETLTETHATRCSLFGILPFCFPGTRWGQEIGRVDIRTVGQDIARLEALYRRTGYFGTRVVPDIAESGEDDNTVQVRFLVERGEGVVLDSVVVQGTEGIVDPDSLEAELPLQPGELLDLGSFAASADTVREALLARGHAYAEVLRNYAVDTIQDRATVWIVGVPGPRVVVDSVVVDGLAELDRGDITRQLTFATGDLLRVSEFQASQRNLYDLEMVQFATVAVAEDTIQRTPEDSTTATARVAITENDEYVVESGAGFGTVQCLGVRGQWTDRVVFGGPRNLTLSGSISRIGAGGPSETLANSLCSQRGDDEIAVGLDYRVAADFTQPYFISPRNRISATAYSERQSEPRLFQRTAHGLRVNGSRRMGTREYVTAALETEFRRMVATPILYCYAFQACGAEEVGDLTLGNWRNAITGEWVRDRGNRPVDPTRGYVLSSTATWSSPVLLSDFNFLRANVEGALYRPFARRSVLAASLRLGSFLTRASLGPDGFVPPEERFYSGGPSSVRGFTRFRLGPRVFVVDNVVSSGGVPDTIPPAGIDPDTLAIGVVEPFPTGGMSVAEVSLEARVPSPFLRDYLRWVVFVDAGAVGLDPLWEMSAQWRVTPGTGARIQTPVGPIRVDVAYNPYPRSAGPLFATEPGTGQLVRIGDDYALPERSVFQRVVIHVAVGQAF